MQSVLLDGRRHRARRGGGAARPRRTARQDFDRRKTPRGRMNFSAVILAGGKSSRMGRDKAFLEIGGQPLLARQIEAARAAGATEVFISGSRGCGLFGVRLPCAERQFSRCRSARGHRSGTGGRNQPLLLVLAVDLPEMNVDFCRPLSTYCKPNAGAVPRIGNELEPLVAFYPKAAQSLAVTLLSENSNAVKYFARCCAKHPGRAG